MSVFILFFLIRALIRERYALIRKILAFIRKSFALSRENKALIRESFAFIRGKKYYFTYENELNGLRNFTIKFKI